MNKKLTLIVFVGFFATIVDHVLADPAKLDDYNTFLQQLGSETGLDVGEKITDPVIKPNPDVTPEADDSTNDLGSSDMATPDKTEKVDNPFDGDDDDDKTVNSSSIQIVVNGKKCEIPEGVDISNLSIINNRCPEFSTTSNNKSTIRRKNPITSNEKKTDSKTKIPETTTLCPPFTRRLNELIAEIEKSPVLFRLGKKKM